jgi:hypothetical protein
MNKIILYACVLSLTACSNEIYRDGRNGDRGAAGSSCHVTQTSTGANINCDDGSSATLVNGTNGLTGARGSDGSSCSVTQLPDASGALISCQDGSNVAVLNGEMGPQGLPGMNATSVSVVQLCPGVNSPYPEQAFLIGEKLYAVYSSSGNASMAVLTPGTYTTTAPGQNCTFTVQPDGVTVTH